MSNISQFFKSGQSGLAPGRNNRRIYASPGPYTFVAPPTTTEVEIHCWGGGGGTQGGGGGGGGGGGYARYVWDTTGGESFALTVGAGQSPSDTGPAGGTTSAECPSQSPGSPIQATGGGKALAFPSSNGGAGGVGSGTVPSPRSSFLITANGGAGGSASPLITEPFAGGGGGGAGSYYGPGGNGAPYVRADIGGGGGSTLTASTNREGAPGHFYPVDAEGWYFVEELVGGDGGVGANGFPATGSLLGDAGHGGFLAGGGGAHMYPTLPQHLDSAEKGGNGGIAGGGGGSRSNPNVLTNGGAGGTGLIIVYYN